MVTSCLDHAKTTSAPPSGWIRPNEADATSLRFPVVAAPTARPCCDIGPPARAQAQATQARELAGIEVFHEGMALTEIGELYRCKGELTLAEKAFVEA